MANLQDQLEPVVKSVKIPNRVISIEMTEFCPQKFAEQWYCTCACTNGVLRNGENVLNSDFTGVQVGREFATMTKRKLLGLKVTSVRTMLHALLM